MLCLERGHGLCSEPASVVALSKAHGLAFSTAHVLRLDKVHVLAPDKAQVSRLKCMYHWINFCYVFVTMAVRR